jgi:hypothetical protein
MPWHKVFLAAAMAAFVTATFLPTEASARWRGWGYGYWGAERGLSAADFCGGRLPAYGTDACGYREVSYGPDSCWRRLPYRPYGPQPRRVWVCG